MCSVSKACKKNPKIPTLLVYHIYLTLSSVYTFIFTELCKCMAGLDGVVWGYAMGRVRRGVLADALGIG